MGLAGEDRLLTQKNDHCIACPRRFDRFGEPIGRSAARSFQRARVPDFDALANQAPDRSERRLADFRIAVEYPGAQLFVGIVRQRADHCE